MDFASFNVLLLIIIVISCTSWVHEEWFCYQVFHNHFVSLNLLLSLGFYIFQFVLWLRISKPLLDFIHYLFNFGYLFLKCEEWLPLGTISVFLLRIWYYLQGHFQFVSAWNHFSDGFFEFWQDTIHKAFGKGALC